MLYKRILILIAFTISVSLLWYQEVCSTSMKRLGTVDPGSYAIHIGSSSRDIRLTEIIELK